MALYTSSNDIKALNFRMSYIDIIDIALVFRYTLYDIAFHLFIGWGKGGPGRFFI